MRYFLRLGVLLALALAVLPLATVRASDSRPGYIQINNGTIVTNTGQEAQVVVQFGNTASYTISGYVACFLDSTYLGYISQTYQGPFPQVAVNPYRTEVRFYNTQYGPVMYTGIAVPPGQNYNVAFNFRTYAWPGTTGSVMCNFHEKYKGALWGTVTAPVRIQ